MFTTCPRCMLNLQVTAGDLRVGQGYVRCGRCDRVFNSLLSLADELPEDDRTNGVAVGTMSLPALPDDDGLPDADAMQPDDADRFELADIEDLVRPARAAPQAQPEPPRAAADTSFTSTLPGEDTIVEEAPTGTFETIVLEGDGYLQTEEMVEESEVDARLEEMVRRFDLGEAEVDTWKGTGADLPPIALRPSTETPAMRPAAAALPPAALAPAPVPAPRPPPPEVSGLAVAGADDAPAPAFPGARSEPPDTARSRLLRLGSIALTLLLLGQVVHHFRAPLAAIPVLGTVLGPLYQRLGAPITRPANLQAFEVRQLGGEPVAGATARIIVRASVRNLADYDQPAPLLRVTLQDRFGKRIAGRDVGPAEYERGAGAVMLAPDQRVDAEMVMEDPASAAVGFEIDACLPDAGGVVHCASELVANGTAAAQ